MMRRTLTLLAVVALAAPFASAAPEVSPLLLKKSPELRFDQVALTDVIDHFRDRTGLNFEVDWKALQDAGLSKDTPVSIRLSAITIRIALRKTLDAAAPGLLAFYVDENVIHITTQAAADARPVVRVYSVADLVKDAPDFTDYPQISIAGGNQGSRTAGGGTGGGGSGGSGAQNLFGGAGGPAAQAGIRNMKTNAERGQGLIDLIEATVRPEVWKTNGGASTIRYANGQIIVTAPADVQRLIGG